MYPAMASTEFTAENVEKVLHTIIKLSFLTDSLGLRQKKKCLSGNI